MGQDDLEDAMKTVFGQKVEADNSQSLDFKQEVVDEGATTSLQSQYKEMKEEAVRIETEKQEKVAAKEKVEKKKREAIAAQNKKKEDAIKAKKAEQEEKEMTTMKLKEIEENKTKNIADLELDAITSKMAEKQLAFAQMQGKSIEEVVQETKKNIDSEEQKKIYKKFFDEDGEKPTV